MAVDIANRRPTPRGPAAQPESAPARARAAPAAAPPDVPAEVSAHRWWIMLGLIMAAALEILDTTVVNVALPQMAGNLGATTDEIAWVSTGLHPRQRHRPADDRLAVGAVRAQALSDGLDPDLQHRPLHVRAVGEPGRDRLLAADPGRGRGRPDLHRAVHHRRDLPAQPDRHRAVHLRPGADRDADAGAAAGRLHHGQLLLADHLLHPRPAGHRLADPGRPVPPGLAAPEAGQHRGRAGDRHAGGGHGVAAICAGRRRALRLVFRPDHRQAGRRGRRRAGRLRLVGTVAAQQGADSGPARPERPGAVRVRRAGPGAGLRAVRRRLHLPAVRADDPRLHARRRPGWPCCRAAS